MYIEKINKTHQTFNMGAKMPKIESQVKEFKPNWRDEYLKTICAFANADGGKLIIGVDDNGNLIGVKNAKKLMEDIPNKVRNKLGIIPSVEIEKKEDKEIIHVLVHPSYVRISYNGNYYKRSGSTNLKLKGKALYNFIMKNMTRHGMNLLKKGQALKILI